MENSNSHKSNNRSWLKRMAFVLGGLLIAVYALSTMHYKTLVLNPIWAWHGANLSVRTMLGVTNANPDLPFDTNAIKRVSDKIKNGELSYQNIALSNKVDRNTELEQRVAENQQRLHQLKESKQALQATKNRLQDAKRNADSLNQNLAAVTAHEQDIATQQQAAENAVSQTDKAPTQEQVNALLAKRGQTNQAGRSTVPVVVLENVQKTTGISADEVNELLNR